MYHSRHHSLLTLLLLSGDFFLCAVIPLLLLIYHPIELRRRYQRLPSALEVTISSAVVLSLWIVYACFIARGRFVGDVYVAPFGVLLGAMYNGSAGRALRLERMSASIGLQVKRVELEDEPLRDSAGPSSFEQNASRKTLLVDV